MCAAVSQWEELQGRLERIAAACAGRLRADLQLGIAALDQFERDFYNGRVKTFDAKHKVTVDPKRDLQSIHEDEDDSTKTPPTNWNQPKVNNTEENKSNKTKSVAPNNVEINSNNIESQKNDKDTESQNEKSVESAGNENTLESQDNDKAKKRSKEEMDGVSSPELEKRHKRNASVRAQGIISKQINANLNAKMRREECEAELEGKSKGRKGRKKPEEENKENVVQNMLPVVRGEAHKTQTISLGLAEPRSVKLVEKQVIVENVKMEKISVPADDVAPMDNVTVPDLPVPGAITVKQEADLMPPPPVRTSRRVKDKPKPSVELDDTSSRRSTRTRKRTDLAGPQTDTRQTRASSRVTSADEEMPPPLPVESRPKRTRAKKKPEPEVRPDSENEEPKETAAEPVKARPKRTRKAAQKQSSKEEEPTPSLPEVTSPIQPKPPKILKPAPTSEVDAPLTKEVKRLLRQRSSVGANVPKQSEPKRLGSLDSSVTDVNLEETRVIIRETIQLKDDTPRLTPNMNETVVIESAKTQDVVSRATVVLQPASKPAMDETVIINKGPTSDQMTNDDSLMTEDDDEIQGTPPQSHIPIKLPVSAVKERVQQFEELATRVTRTKTRALAKNQIDDTESHSSPSDNENVQKGNLTAATLAKLNNLPNYRTNQISLSATKPRANIVTSVKSFLPSSTSKASVAAIAKAKKLQADQDAQQKKRELLEAAMEEKKRRHQQKMEAAAKSREEAAKKEAAKLEATAKRKQEKEAYLNQGNIERMKELERKKQLQERKLAEAEDRRRAEETARQAKLEEEQRKEAARRKQQEQADKMRKEEIRMEREMQQARQQYLEKEKEKERQKTLMKAGHTPLRTPGTPCGAPRAPLPPAHMEDGFQYLNSDSEDEDAPKRRPPNWSRTQQRLERLAIQVHISTADIDKLFSVQRHTPDLGELFPGIERKRLVRTSSAVWRTPPRLECLPGIAE